VNDEKKSKQLPRKEVSGCFNAFVLTFVYFCTGIVFLDRLMYGIKLQDRIPSKGLRERPGLDDIISVLQQYRLQWYGHVLRKEGSDWVKKCMEYEVEGARPKGRPKKTERLWKKTVRHVN